jgi:ricin-type beta-trefoil lectin protein
MAKGEEDKYVISFIKDQQPTGYCIGVHNVQPSAPAVLSLVSGTPNTVWEMDPTTGYIRSSGNAGLCLDIEGNSVKNGVRLVLAQVVPGRLYQKWNWVGSPPRIYNVGAPKFCIDLKDCKLDLGTQIQIHDESGKCQSWTEVPVALAAQLAA